MAMHINNEHKLAQNKKYNDLHSTDKIKQPC
jgi:hypothetical protein